MQPNRFDTVTQTRSGMMDAGLKSHMQRVYNRMTLGVLVTALTSWLVSSSPELMKLFMGGPQAYIVMFAPLAVIWFGFRPERMNSQQLLLGFLALAVLYGISFSVIALAFAGETIARAFFMTSALFAGLSIFGYTTRKNLDGLGTFAIMGVMGVFILSIGTMVAGMFGVETSFMQTLIAGIGIVAFSGVTAWQTQTTKEMYHAAAGDEINSRMAWAAALNLYLSFTALFQYIIHFLQPRE